MDILTNLSEYSVPLTQEWLSLLREALSALRTALQKINDLKNYIMKTAERNSTIVKKRTKKEVSENFKNSETNYFSSSSLSLLYNREFSRNNYNHSKTLSDNSCVDSLSCTPSCKHNLNRNSTNRNDFTQDFPTTELCIKKDDNLPQSDSSNNSLIIKNKKKKKKREISHSPIRTTLSNEKYALQNELDEYSSPDSKSGKKSAYYDCLDNETVGSQILTSNSKTSNSFSEAETSSESDSIYYCETLSPNASLPEYQNSINSSEDQLKILFRIKNNSISDMDVKEVLKNEGFHKCIVYVKNKKTHSRGTIILVGEEAEEVNAKRFNIFIHGQPVKILSYEKIPPDGTSPKREAEVNCTSPAMNITDNCLTLKDDTTPRNLNLHSENVSQHISLLCTNPQNMTINSMVESSNVDNILVDQSIEATPESNAVQFKTNYGRNSHTEKVSTNNPQYRTVLGENCFVDMHSKRRPDFWDSPLKCNVQMPQNSSPSHSSSEIFSLNTMNMVSQGTPHGLISEIPNVNIKDFKDTSQPQKVDDSCKRNKRGEIDESMLINRTCGYPSYRKPFYPSSNFSGVQRTPKPSDLLIEPDVTNEDRVNKVYNEAILDSVKNISPSCSIEDYQDQSNSVLTGSTELPQSVDISAQDHIENKTYFFKERGQASPSFNVPENSLFALNKSSEHQLLSNNNCSFGNRNIENVKSYSNVNSHKYSHYKMLSYSNAHSQNWNNRNFQSGNNYASSYYNSPNTSLSNHRNQRGGRHWSCNNRGRPFNYKPYYYQKNRF